MLLVPMLKENELIGAIVIYRQEVRPFTEKQIALVQNFAAQAVIAIENARLLNELRARTTELARSVEELRALGDVSQAVNSTLDLKDRTLCHHRVIRASTRKNGGVLSRSRAALDPVVPQATTYRAVAIAIDGYTV